jgi:hypothetical protein
MSDDDERLIPEDEWAENFGWSEDEDGDSNLIGFYLCDRARRPEDENIVGTIPPTDEG